MAFTIAETSRKLIAADAASGIGVWKADDSAETHIVITRIPSIDPDDNSILAVRRDGSVVYLGTTALGKDGIAGVTVFNDGEIVLWVPEAAAPGDPGNTADLYMVKLALKLPAEPVTASTEAVDTTAREQIVSIVAKLAAVKAALG